MIPLSDDNPIRITPYVTYVILGLCVVVYLWQISLGADDGRAAVNGLGFVPASFFGAATASFTPQWLPSSATLVSSMFMHGGIMHLLGNMLYLWIFADNIEDSMGSSRFVIFYLLCGALAALSHAALDTDSAVPMIGASGAISGVLGAYALLYPRAHVHMLVPVFVIFIRTRLPALAVLGLWFLLQLISAQSAGSQGGGVAFGAHIGGFVAGLVLIPLFRLSAVNAQR